MRFFLPLAVLVLACLGTQIQASCITSPLLALEAGVSSLSAQVNGPHPIKCEASLVFSNVDFLPLHVNFSPITCDGQQVATFLIPQGVPNGEADVEWRCAGMGPTCSRATISKGRSDLSLSNVLNGTLGCLVEALRTTSITTTYTTKTATLTLTTPAIITALTTSFPSIHDMTSHESMLGATASSPKSSLISTTETPSTTMATPTNSVGDTLLTTDSSTDTSTNTPTDTPATEDMTALLDTTGTFTANQRSLAPSSPTNGTDDSVFVSQAFRQVPVTALFTLLQVGAVFFLG